MKVLASADTKRRIVQQDAIPRGTDPDTFRRYVAADVARWVQVAKETGTKAE
jgi:tripartite-type tricarboxylate transporter receptor subunit TctC